ncbi:MAG: PAC2 family protein [Dehalococcoidales bacterium]|nr:MAG: PAC2 family protein [Dehalococcoidales bacterium]
MRLRAFELDEPVPELRDPHAVVMLKPWVDVGRAGSIVIAWMENQLGVKDLAKLDRPGDFFDFTRHRPTSFVSAGRRRMTIPNTYVTYSKQQSGNDFIFLRLLEPHHHGEEYVESVLDLMQKFGVKRYTIVGSMHDFVPHTRPLTVTGEAIGKNTSRQLEENGVTSIEYRGPTSICFLISQRAPDIGMETMSLIAHLPQYTQMKEDFNGAVRLMHILSSIYNIPVDQSIENNALRQMEQINTALESNPQLKSIVNQLENLYDNRSENTEDHPATELSPEVEQFLAEMDRRFREDPQ